MHYPTTCFWRPLNAFYKWSLKTGSTICQCILLCLYRGDNSSATPTTVVDSYRVHSTNERRILVSLSCPCVLTCVIIATCAITASTKLPLPFKTLTIYLLYLDIVIILLGFLECWIGHYISYLREFEDMGLFLMLSTVTMLCIERSFALKCPLKYITLCSKERLVKACPSVTWVVVFGLFLTFRVFVCYFSEWSLERHSCYEQRRYFAIGMDVTLNSVAILCFITVVHVISKNKRQHSRRITRMGLPQTHAGNATNTHISATLFIIFPPMFAVTLAFILTEYWKDENFERMMASYTVGVSFLLCFFHGMVYIFWFDECRLYVLTLFSPLHSNIRVRADAMRIEVYNIVIAQAFELGNQSNHVGTVIGQNSENEQPKNLNSNMVANARGNVRELAPVL